MLARIGSREPTKRAIVLIDDHPLLRRGLAALIECEPDLVVSAEAGDIKAAFHAMASSPPDLAIVDLTLEGGADGLDVVKAMKIKHPLIPSLVLSSHDDAIHAQRAYRAGARGYVNKQQVCTDVLVAIRRVLAGQIYVSDAVAVNFAADLVRGDGVAMNAIATLSDRELQVLRLIGAGNKTREIAVLLNLSQKTIETYRENVKRKLGLKTAVDLMRRAVQFVDHGR